MSDNLPVRASDTERDRTVVALRDACAAGRLTLEEFSERADLAYAAATRADLEPLTRDLPAEAAETRPRRYASRFLVSVFGGSDRRGRWRVPPWSLVVSVFGGSDLDLRQAVLAGPEATFYAISVFGGSDFYVPEGVEVDLAGIGIFGGNDEHGDEGEIHPGAPCVRVVAISVFGGCDVWHVPRGERGSQKELRRAARGRCGILAAWKVVAASASRSEATPRI